MKLIEILQSIKTIALRNPFVKSAYIGDIYSILNPTAEIKYSVVTVDITELSRDDIGANYTVVLNYADRTLQDNSNVKEILSDAFSCLTSIINDITESLEGETDNFTLSTFEQKFNDYCAGASAQFQLTLASEMGDCDINDDYDPIEREIDITENGTYDVTDYNIANVNVEPKLEAAQRNLSLYGLEGSFTISPEPGYDGFSIVNATYTVDSIVETVDIDTNGEYVYTGHDGGPLKEITVRVNVPDTKITDVIWLTQDEYDVISEPSLKTLYNIVDDNDNEKLIKQYQGDTEIWRRVVPFDGLTFTAEKAGSTVKYIKSYQTNAEYSTDGTNWSDANGVTITLNNVGDKVYFRGEILGNQYQYYVDVPAHFEMTGIIAASGNVNSLNNNSDVLTQPYSYYRLFENCTSLTKAPELPATTLTNCCYCNMFQGCASLTDAPELPATYLALNCYSGMFQYCTSLTKAPKLPATYLAIECYDAMFQGCTSLTDAPELPATNLVWNCYEYMFRYCTSLTTAPELPATKLVKECYYYMFAYCTSLNKVIVHATSWNTSYTFGWLSGVSPTGDFYNLGGAVIPINHTAGVPTGWTTH